MLIGEIGQGTEKRSLDQNGNSTCSNATSSRHRQLNIIIIFYILAQPFGVFDLFTSTKPIVKKDFF